MTTKNPFPEFPEISSADGEYAYVAGCLESSIRNLHDRLYGLAAYEGVCKDLRDIPVTVAKLLERRRACK